MIGNSDVLKSLQDFFPKVYILNTSSCVRPFSKQNHLKLVKSWVTSQTMWSNNKQTIICPDIHFQLSALWSFPHCILWDTFKLLLERTEEPYPDFSSATGSWHWRKFEVTVCEKGEDGWHFCSAPNVRFSRRFSSHWKLSSGGQWSDPQTLEIPRMPVVETQGLVWPVDYCSSGSMTSSNLTLSLALNTVLVGSAVISHQCSSM